MQLSTSSAGIPEAVWKRTASNRYGKRSRLTTNPAVSGTGTTVLPIASHQAVARSEIPSFEPSSTQSSTRSIRGTGLKGWSPNTRSPCPEASPIAATPSEEVVVARSASGRASPSAASNSPLAETSSTIASTTRSHPSRSARSVVTVTFAASAPSSLPANFSIEALARSADSSERASTTTSSPVVEATAASPHAMVPVPAIATFP